MDMISALAPSPFVRYVTSLAVAALGDALVFVALPFLVLQSGGDGRAVAATLAASAASRFLGPVMGAWADHLPPGQAIAGAGMARALLFAALGTAVATGGAPLGMVYLAAFAAGSLQALVFTAGNVALPRLVPPAGLARANGWVQAANMGVPLLGYGLGGVLVSAVGAAGAVLTAAPSMLAAAALMRTVPVPVPRADEPAPASGPGRVHRFVRAAGAGVTAFRGTGPLLLVPLLSLGLNVALAFLAARMPVAMQALGLGARGYGSFQACVSAGMLLGIAVVAVLGPRARPAPTVTASLALLAMGFAALTQDAYPVWLGAAATLGLGVGVAEVALITLLQRTVADAVRGRATGALFAANAAGQTGGAALAGAVAAANATVFAGAALAAVLAAAGWSWACLQAMRRGEAGTSFGTDVEGATGRVC